MALVNVALQCLMGMRFKDFVILAADQTLHLSLLLLMKDDEYKIHAISEHVAMGVIGDPSDTSQLTQYIAKTVKLHHTRTGNQLDVDATVHLARKSLADAMKNKVPYAVGILFGGYDDAGGPQLYYMDYLATCVPMNYAVHGLGGSLTLSIMDNLYKPTMTKQEAYNLIKACIAEIQARFVVNYHKFQVVIVDSHGIRFLDSLVATELEI